MHINFFMSTQSNMADLWKENTSNSATFIEIKHKMCLIVAKSNLKHKL